MSYIPAKFCRCTDQLFDGIVPYMFLLQAFSNIPFWLTSIDLAGNYTVLQRAEQLKSKKSCLDAYLETVSASLCSQLSISIITTTTIMSPPGEFNVICGRGQSTFLHSGNKIFRAIIEHNFALYSEANTTLEKSLVVSRICSAVRERVISFNKALTSNGSRPAND